MTKIEKLTMKINELVNLERRVNSYKSPEKQILTIIARQMAKLQTNLRKETAKCDRQNERR